MVDVFGVGDSFVHVLLRDGRVGPKGELVYDLDSLSDIRDRTHRTLERLPPAVRTIKDPSEYPVTVSDGLEATTETLEAELRAAMDL